jgi:hypothetical protein
MKRKWRLEFLVVPICHSAKQRYLSPFCGLFADRPPRQETARGEIARSARSHLDPTAQPYQDFIDRLFYAMAGLTDDESRGLEERLARML